MVWAPHVTVAAVAERDGRFLLVEEHRGGRDVLNQPAGHLEPGESLLQAVVRETLEETAWEFVPHGLVGLYRWVHPDNGETFLRATFHGELTRWHSQRELDPDISRTLWLDAGELAAAASRLRSPLVLTAVQDYLAGCRYPLALLREL